jgi:DNA ligase (NAD+)
MNYVSKNDSNKLDKTSPYYQKSFVITGSFDIPRHKIKELLEQKYDANVLETVTKSVDYLIVGKDGGSKQEKANKLGIKVITDKI